MKNKFINLRAYSHYSKFQSILNNKDIINFAVNNDHFAIGLCDYNFFGAVRFCQLALKKQIKPILGILVPVETVGLLPIYVKSVKGYKSLSSLISRLSIYETLATFEDLEQLEDVVVLTGDQSIFYKNSEHLWEKYLKILKKIFQDDLYIELIPNLNYTNLLPLADKLNINVVLTIPAQMKGPEDKKALYTINLINHGKYFDQDEFSNFSSDAFLRTKVDFHIQEAIENTIIIGQKCSFAITSKAPIIPKVSDNEEKDLYDLSKRKLDIKLKEIPQEQHEIYYKRLDQELKVLIDKKFCGYFLVTADFVQYARNNNIVVGPGRGSGAGSLIAYALGITNVDPIKFQLIFERFLNPERNSMPDFDIDFDPQGRNRIIQYLKDKFGKYNVANIITYGTYHSKGLIQALCKIFRIPFVKALKITKLIPFSAVRPITLSEALNMVPELKKYSQEYPHIFELCKRLEGVMRNTSKHAAGIIISNKPIYQQCPLIKDKDDLITQFNFKDMEKVGGVKFDFLGLMTLSILQQTGNNVNVKIDNIPLDDPKAIELFQQAQYLEGIFQFESSFMKSILKPLKPTNINDLIAVNALGRPGPMAHIPDYIKNKKDPSKIQYAHPLLKSILADTFGVLVYQEQVMNIASTLGGYSMAEADILRRAMGKKQLKEMAAQRIRFLKGCKKNNISEKIAEGIFDRMNEFSSYGFNKGHSTPYAILGYQCAYLKAHFPREFISTCINLESSNKEKVCRYVSEAKNMGFEIYGPHINHSMELTQVERQGIRLGFLSIKNTNKNLIQNIVSERKKKPYESVYDFVQRNINYLNKKNWDCLVYSEALKIWGTQSDLLENFQGLRRGEKIYSSSLPNKISGERLGIGFFINHPIVLVSDLSLINSQRAKTFEKNRTIFLGGSILKYTIKSSKSKRSFGIIELQDNHGLIDITCFQKNVENKALKDGNFVVIEARVSGKDSNRFTAQNIWTVNEYLSKHQKLNVQLENRQAIKSFVELMKKQPSGSTFVKALVNHRSISSKFKILDSLELRNEIKNLNIMII